MNKLPFQLYYKSPYRNTAFGKSTEYRYDIVRSDTGKIIAYCNNKKDADIICGMSPKEKVKK